MSGNPEGLQMKQTFHAWVMRDEVLDHLAGWAATVQTTARYPRQARV